MRVRLDTVGVASVVLIAALVGCSDGGGGGAQQPTPSAEPSKVSLAAALTAYDDADVTAAIAAAGTPSGGKASSSTDEGAALRIAAAMKAAGFDLGADVFVVPLAADRNLLYISSDEAGPLSTLTDTRVQAFLTALLNSPALGKDKVTRIAIDFVANDSKGRYTASITGTVVDLKAALLNQDKAAQGRIATEVTRG